MKNEGLGVPFSCLEESNNDNMHCIVKNLLCESNVTGARIKKVRIEMEWKVTNAMIVVLFVAICNVTRSCM